MSCSRLVLSGAQADREVGEFEANAWQSGHDAVELDVAEGDGRDAAGCLHPPASL